MVGRYYPEMPPALEGETDEQYTDRLTGADGTGRVPYDHRRFRGCSIGYHGECSQRIDSVTACQCPCHTSEVQPVLPLTTEEIDAIENRMDVWGDYGPDPTETILRLIATVRALQSQAADTETNFCAACMQ